MFNSNKSRTASLVVGSEKVVDPITKAVKELEKKNQDILEFDATLATEVEERLEMRADLATQMKVNEGRIERLKAVL